MDEISPDGQHNDQEGVNSQMKRDEFLPSNTVHMGIKEMRYKKADVIMHLVETFEYKGTFIQIVRFVEVIEGMNAKNEDI